MTFDALTLAAVRDELAPALVDSRVQRLVFPDELSLAMECFAPGHGRTVVLLSAHPEWGRVQRLETLPGRGIERDTPWVLVARKHLRNARIRSLRQPRLERVLELDCEQRDDSGQHYQVQVIVEAMGRRSNLVLVDQDGVILDAVRRSPPSRNPRRPVLPHLPYAVPPPQDRLLPEALTPEAFLGTRGTLAKALADKVAGLSPQGARELAFRVCGRVDAEVAEVDVARVIRDVQQFMAPPVWQPTLALRDGQPAAYAPYRLTHLVSDGLAIEDQPSISAAMTAYYAAAPVVARGDALAGERKALLAALDQTLANVTRRVSALQHQLTTSQDNVEPLRRAGELLLTYPMQVPAGAAEVELDGVRIALDSTLSAVDNAQAYFLRYRKAREGLERVPVLLEEARNQAEHLAELRALVEVAQDMTAIRALRREVRGDAAPARGTKASAGPYRRVPLDGGFEALIGTSARGNAAVTFDLASADDLWLHARGVPGAHVILRSRGSSEAPPESTVIRAAELAAHYSAARESARVEVDVAPRRHVRKIPNAPPGLVRYSNERTLRVSPRAS